MSNNKDLLTYLLTYLLNLKYYALRASRENNNNMNFKVILVRVVNRRNFV